MRFLAGRWVLVAAVTGSMLASAASGNDIKRYFGIGWGDGYHVGTTGCPDHRCWGGAEPISHPMPTPSSEHPVPATRSPEQAVPPPPDQESFLPAETVGPAPRLVRLPPVEPTQSWWPGSGVVVRLPPVTEPSTGTTLR